MVAEVVSCLASAPAGIVIDATLGGAGHAVALLKASPVHSVIGIDRDPVARAAARARLEPFGDRAHVLAGRFEEIVALVASVEVDQPITGALFDLGVSSPQLDDPARGFSYRHDGPLDMRMNREQRLTAGEIVNEWPAPEIARVLREYGDERFADRIARRIVDQRPFDSTVALAEVVVEAIPAATRRTGGHPAKRTFQALRIAVNAELTQITPAINDAIDLLAAQGIGAVLSYHSGEDRLVKHTLREAETGGCTCPPRLPCGCGAVAKIELLRPAARRPSDGELATNSRSSSARLRCFRRVRSETAANPEARR